MNSILIYVMAFAMAISGGNLEVKNGENLPAVEKLTPVIFSNIDLLQVCYDAKVEPKVLIDEELKNGDLIVGFCIIEGKEVPIALQQESLVQKIQTGINQRTSDTAIGKVIAVNHHIISYLKSFNKTIEEVENRQAKNLQADIIFFKETIEKIDQATADLRAEIGQIDFYQPLRYGQNPDDLRKEAVPYGLVRILVETEGRLTETEDNIVILKKKYDSLLRVLFLPKLKAGVKTINPQT